MLKNDSLFVLVSGECVSLDVVQLCQVFEFD